MGQAHPRIRGEYFLRTKRLSTRLGSPPHTRGIHNMNGPTVSRLRLTPAYAGNTTSSTARSSPTRAHPRIRGEYCICDSGPRPIIGSPPHTRGIQRPVAPLNERNWLTPAYAGNTWIADIVKEANEAHPRIRGEYFTCWRTQSRFTGSPPHTRGIRLLSSLH